MEALADPMGDRVVKTVKPPPQRPLFPKMMYNNPCNQDICDLLAKPDVPNLQIVRQHLVDQGTVGRAELVKLVKDVTAVFSKSTCPHIDIRKGAQHLFSQGAGRHHWRYPRPILRHDSHVRESNRS